MPNNIVYRPSFRKRGQSTSPFGKSLSKGSWTGLGGVEIGGTATFIFGGPQVPSDIVIEWDFDNDGDFSDPEEDITSLVLDAETFTGRDWPSLLTGKAGPGKLKATLRNDDDRFNYFNQDSPLNAGSFSLKTGRKVRVRTATAVVADPVVLARDRFNRADGALGTDETGMSWSGPLADDFTITSNRAVATNDNAQHIGVVDVTVTDYYAQAQISVVGTVGNKIGLVYRYQDSTNYSLAYVDIAAQTFNLVDVVAGASSVVGSVGVEVYGGIIVGVLVNLSSVTGYVEGIPLVSATAIQTDETEVGIWANWALTDSAPEIDNFQVWDVLPSEVEGILWTGDISELISSVSPGPRKQADISGEGWLSKLATQKVAPPTSTTGRNTGLLIGNILGMAGLLNPPGPIDEGDVTTGIFAVAESTAIDIARDVEETEFGFLFETQEGPLGFDNRSARDSAVSAVTFSDVAHYQYGYTAIEPMDWRREVFNRVVAGVSPFTEGVEAVLYTDPGPYVLTSGQSQQLVATYDGIVAEWTGHTRDVSIAGTPAFTSITVKTGSGATYDVVMPATVTAGDLLIIIFVAYGTDVWDNVTPSGWTRLTSDGGGYLARIADGTEDGTNVNLDATGANAAWASQVYRIAAADWYGGSLTDGVVLGSYTTGTSVSPNAPSVSPGWGSIPTLWISSFVNFNVNTSLSSGPSGYTGATYTEVNSPFSCAIGSARKVSTSSSENAGAFTTAASAFWSARTIAVRGPVTTTPVSSSSPQGFSPRFTVSYSAAVGGTTQSHTNIEVTGIPIVEGSAVSVEVNDVTSQDDHNAIRTYVNPANLFANTDDATTYANLVLARYADDRPILSISFFPVKSAAYRAQAIRRRVSDKITLVAENNSGLGISQDFFIESISHKFSHGTTLWETTWELSPA